MIKNIQQQYTDCIALWYVVQHSLTAYNKLLAYFKSAEHALNPKHINEWQSLKIHDTHIKRLQTFFTPQGQHVFKDMLLSIQNHADFILLRENAHYPQQLLPYSDCPPLLFGQGCYEILEQPQIAIVGSRKPSIQGKQTSYEFADYLAKKGFVINSGLAYGIDQAAHQAGVKYQRTIAVMATGLDQTYPQSNSALRTMISKNGAVITEFLPYTKPLQHHFPRRNRIVSGLSLGTLVVEATLKSGSLITAKLAAEQGKLIFAIPGNIYHTYNQGCHQLIREGAILVDHPEQMIEDLALPTHWQAKEQQESLSFALTEAKLANQDAHLSIPSQPEAQNTSAIPTHLFQLYQLLDWSGKSLDQIALDYNGSIADLTALLMELELHGACIQHNGLYQRCRLAF